MSRDDVKAIALVALCALIVVASIAWRVYRDYAVVRLLEGCQ